MIKSEIMKKFNKLGEKVEIEGLEDLFIFDNWCSDNKGVR